MWLQEERITVSFESSWFIPSFGFNMHRSLFHRCVLVGPAWGLIQRGDFDGALSELDRRKSLLALDEGVDFLRAICFLNKNDPLHARQALLEELRCHPTNTDARDLLSRVHDKLEPVLALPKVICEREPLFAMFYDGVRDHTMLDWTRLLGLFLAAKRICEDGTLGDFVECGVAGGGATILLALAVAHFSAASGTPLRRVFACDTFSGMPSPSAKDKKTDTNTHADKSHWSTGTCSGSAGHVERLAKLFSVEDIVRVVEGDFAATLPRLPTDHIALLHADSDWYDSTKVTLDNLYHRVVPRGIIQIDDYGYWSGCRAAVDEFLASRGINQSAVVSIGPNAAVITL